MSAKRPRALVMTPDFPPARGGIQTLMHELATRLEAFDVHVVTFDGADAQRVDQGVPARVHRMRRRPRSHRAAVLALNARAAQVAVERRPDIVVSGHVVMTPAAEFTRRVLRRPVLQYVHGDEFAQRPALCARAVRHADETIAVSRYTRDLAIKAGAPLDRVHLIPPGVTPPTRPSGARSSRPTIVTVARMAQPRKGHDTIIRALPLVREAVPDVRWIVIGDGPLRPALQRDAAIALGDAARFLGEVDEAERDAWLDRSHVFCLPNRDSPGGGGGEGFGIVFLEAASHGLPVVAGRAGGALDAVVDGATGILVAPEDPAALSRAVIELLSDPGRAEALGSAGRQRAAEFAWPLIAERVERLMLETCGRR